MAAKRHEDVQVRLSPEVLRVDFIQLSDKANMDDFPNCCWFLDEIVHLSKAAHCSQQDLMVLMFSGIWGIREHVLACFCPGFGLVKVHTKA